MPDTIPRGTVVLVPFPFTDLSSEKLRPAVVISNELVQEKDVCVAFITSQLPAVIPADGILIKEDNEDFPSTGLKTSSIIRTNKIATLDRKVVLGMLGNLSPKLVRELNKKLICSLGS